MTSEANTKTNGRHFGLAFLAVGCLITLAGLVWLFQTMSFVKRAAKAPGQITAVEVETDSDGTMYRPTYTFTDLAGTVHTQRSGITSSNRDFEEGEGVTVLYDPANPKDSKIDSFTSVWLFPVITAGFGLLFGGFAGLWLFLWTRAAAPDSSGKSYDDTSTW